MSIEAVPGGCGGVRVVRAAGELDVAVAPDLLPRVPELVAGAEAVVLDLTQVAFLDSSGVRLVNRFARACGGDGTPFRVVAPPGGITRRVLEIVGFGPPLVLDDLAAAVATVRAASA